jgi:hypothetical protein
MSIPDAELSVAVATYGLRRHSPRGMWPTGHLGKEWSLGETERRMRIDGHDVARRMGAGDVIVKMRDLLEQERHEEAVALARRRLDPAPATSCRSRSIPMLSAKQRRLSQLAGDPLLRHNAPRSTTAMDSSIGSARNDGVSCTPEPSTLWLANNQAPSTLILGDRGRTRWRVVAVRPAN